MQENKLAVLNGNHLKLIAAVTMLLDHAGILLFPKIMLFRILGRLAYPIYAYMIAEGCRYTRNKLRYFLMVFGLGTACQLVYYFASGDTYLNILKASGELTKIIVIGAISLAVIITLIVIAIYNNVSKKKFAG